MAIKAGRELSTIDKLFWCSTVPKIGDPVSMGKLERACDKIAGGVLVIDPTYLALPNIDPGNIFSQGGLLRTLDEVCQPREITIILNHHLKKGRANVHDPPELSDLSWSGFAEWARQWILLSRRERYEPPDVHRLWMVNGGSAGHAGFHGLDIQDQDESGRCWNVAVVSASAVRNEDVTARQREKTKAKEAVAIADITAVREFLATKLPEGETVAAVSKGAKVPYRRADSALRAMENDGVVEDCEVTKRDRKGGRPGWKLVDADPPSEVDLSAIVGGAA